MQVLKQVKVVVYVFLTFLLINKGYSQVEKVDSLSNNSIQDSTNIIGNLNEPKSDSVQSLSGDTLPNKNQISQKKTTTEFSEGISGTLLDSANGEALIGASITIEGKNLGASSDLDGFFSIPNVEDGQYTLKISYLGYRSTVVKTTVKNGKSQKLSLNIAPEANTLKEVQVVGVRRTNTEAAVIQEVKASDNVVSAISSEQIAKSQDRDASEVVKRVPGVTIVENRFIIIRGLSERYNPVMLNNVMAPSAEQDVRAFSFDIVPSGLIDRVLIYKTPSPEIPGDFGGGLIKVFTKSIPDANTLTVGYSSSVRPGSSFKPFYEQERGKGSWLGLQDDARKLPSDFPADLRNIPSSDKDRINAVSKSLPNNWEPTKYNSNIDNRFNLTGTRKFKIGGVDIGNITALTYSNTKVVADVVRKDFNSFDIVSNKPYEVFSYNDQQYNHNIRVGAIHNWAVRFNANHKVEFKNLYNKNWWNQYVLRTGENFEEQYKPRSHSFRNINRDIYSGQLTGKHDIFKELTSVEWAFGYSSARRNEPDYKRIRTDEYTEDSTYHSTYIPVNVAPFFLGRFFSEMNEKIHAQSVNIVQKLPFNENFVPEAKFGVYHEKKSRSFAARNLGYIMSSAMNFDQSLYYVPFAELFSEKNMNATTGLKLAEQTKGSDSYSAGSDLFAYYLGLNLPVGNKFKIYGGARIENYKLRLDSRNETNDPVGVNNLVTSVLPSANLTFNFTEKMLIRAAYGVSLNRQEFRELAPFAFYDFNTNFTFYGNPDLKPSTIHNFDLRWELYPTSSEFISLGVFYKNFINPIETFFVPGAGSGGARNFTYKNAASATSQGIELELRKALDNLTPFKVINNLSLVLNTSLIRSEIDLGGQTAAQTNKRPLQGQSPYIVNTGIYYNSENQGLQVNLLYNVIGKRILYVGFIDYPDIYEMPRNIVDFTVTKKIGKHLEFKGGVQDIFNTTNLLMQDGNQDGKFERNGKDQEISKFRIGSYYTLGLNYKF